MTKKRLRLFATKCPGCGSKNTKVNWRCFVAVLLFANGLFGITGCGTFSGISSDERDQANHDLAKESGYLPALSPERSLQDNREIPAHVQ